MNLPLSAWTWNELQTAYARLADSHETLREMGHWRNAAYVRQSMVALDEVLRRRSLELQQHVDDQMTLTHPGAYGGETPAA